jgi:iron complex outermembrane receptor protein
VPLLARMAHAGHRANHQRRQSVSGTASAAGATLVNAARRGRAGAYDSGDLNQYSSSPSGLLNLSYRVTDDLLTYATLTTLWTAANGGYEGLLGAPRTLGVTGRYDF